ncbi:hypothetical protein RBE51_19990 [Pseudomonas taiwanensis]|uniref:hypothetical protein n=1 Tax=Pseudomonas taiwanensis TaxID=470150 RepID=UPI0028E05920|nr:hypothetical protein [Pseudomonas taiwanensis]MDT8925074.1 hypothetical protein [Pseudomonas taiwanensis]
MLKKALSLLVLATALQGCTTSLIEGQKQELATYEAKGLKVNERNEALAAGLGVLPMVGYFYSGNYVLAFTTLPLYPFLGPLWMPFDTHNAAQARNYYATRTHAQFLKDQKLVENDKKYEDKTLTEIQYIRAQREIERQYAPY